MHGTTVRRVARPRRRYLMFSKPHALCNNNNWCTILAQGRNDVATVVLDHFPPDPGLVMRSMVVGDWSTVSGTEMTEDQNGCGSRRSSGWTEDRWPLWESRRDYSVTVGGAPAAVGMEGRAACDRRRPAGLRRRCRQSSWPRRCAPTRGRYVRREWRHVGAVLGNRRRRCADCLRRRPTPATWGSCCRPPPAAADLRSSGSLSNCSTSGFGWTNTTRSPTTRVNEHQ